MVTSDWISEKYLPEGVVDHHILVGFFHYRCLFPKSVFTSGGNSHDVSSRQFQMKQFPAGEITGDVAVSSCTASTNGHRLCR